MVSAYNNPRVYVSAYIDNGWTFYRVNCTVPGCPTDLSTSNWRFATTVTRNHLRDHLRQANEVRRHVEVIRGGFTSWMVRCTICEWSVDKLTRAEVEPIKSIHLNLRHGLGDDLK